MNQIPLWHHKNVPLEKRDSIAAEVLTSLKRSPFFSLWLEGPIGSGKTTITGSLLRGLGLPENIPVSSPTFTYLNDYRIAEKTYAHLDFYRLESNSHPISDLLAYLDYDGMIIEWPQMLGPHTQNVSPTHILKIEKGEDDACRSYIFYELRNGLVEN